MSRKRDPVTTVLDYFEDAELPLAQQALSLARPSRAKPAATNAPTTNTSLN